jgi:hypothetical protein
MRNHVIKIASNTDELIEHLSQIEPTMHVDIQQVMEDCERDLGQTFIGQVVTGQFFGQDNVAYYYICHFDTPEVLEDGKAVYVVTETGDDGMVYATGIADTVKEAYKVIYKYLLDDIIANKMCDGTNEWLEDQQDMFQSGYDNPEGIDEFIQHKEECEGGQPVFVEFEYKEAQFSIIPYTKQ